VRGGIVQGVVEGNSSYSLPRWACVSSDCELDGLNMLATADSGRCSLSQSSYVWTGVSASEGIRRYLPLRHPLQ